MTGVPYKFETETLREVHKPGDFPPGRSYVIQFFEPYSVHHEGDERSRRAPGHGYPAWTETGVHIRQFATTHEAEWRDAIDALYQADKGRTDILAFVAQRVGIHVRAQIEIISPTQEGKRDG